MMSRFRTIVTGVLLAVALAYPVVAFGYINGGFRSKSEAERYYERWGRPDKQQRLRAERLAEEAWQQQVAEQHQQQYLQQLGRLNAAIERDSNDLVALYQRGKFFQESQNFENAMADFNKVIERDPQFARALFRRSFLWMRTNDHRRALADLDEAVRLEPTYAPSHFHRGALLFAYRYFHERNLCDARHSAQAACDLAQRRRETRKANFNQDEATRDDSQHAQYCEMLAAIAAALGDFSAAIEWETKAVQFRKRTATQSLSKYQRNEADADAYLHVVRYLSTPIQ